ncbi:VOC family protein [Piscinibacter gummiphilus]|uniref:Glyoxalase n=1 Tax=Piscinibacter gummiphilus TaxID=946333 RepID=A0A1W6LC59_9BURK|nr:VOC family protein [Piscinibacter gummiphilus]ARN21839.1 glyoxalase [Piscinibacter gummiphilus]ATU66526.1 glyoxalase [Piscinibacter gummiphilus]GLS93892.1 glyoxalase [Piscinibacter gummiphilus]
MNLQTLEMKAYVPARDLTQSSDFYSALGFEVDRMSDAMAFVRFGSTAFLLQEFFVEQHAHNFMMHLIVENVDDWYANVMASGVVERFGVRVDPPQDQPWGLRDFPLVDPTGVLWRVAQEISA